MLTEETMRNIIADNLRNYYGFGPDPSDIKIHEATMGGTWAIFSVGMGYKYEFTAAVFPLDIARMLNCNYYEVQGSAILANGGRIRQLAPTWVTEEYERSVQWRALTPDQAKAAYKKELERIYEEKRAEREKAPADKL